MEGKLWSNNVMFDSIKPIEPTFIIFKGKDNLEILKLEPNGDIFVKGRLVENDKQVVEGMRSFLLSNGY
jgi:hypothetical protein